MDVLQGATLPGGHDKQKKQPKTGPPRLEWSLGWTEPDESQNPKKSQKHVNHI